MIRCMRLVFLCIAISEKQKKPFALLFDLCKAKSKKNKSSMTRNPIGNQKIISFHILFSRIEELVIPALEVSLIYN